MAEFTGRGIDALKLKKSKLMWLQVKETVCYILLSGAYMNMIK